MLRFRIINSIFFTSLLVVLIADYFLYVSAIFYLLIVFSWFMITLLGSVFITWDYHFPSIHRNIVIKENFVAITFDDGPNPEYTPKVLSILKQFNTKATFFCIGKQIDTHPDLFQKIVSEGHTVGNHTYSHHNNFGFFSSAKVIDELQKTNTTAKKISGLEMKLFRPAFGVTNPRIKKALQVTGLISVGWSKRSFDTTNLSEEIIFKRVTKKLTKGDIILLHDSSEKTLRVLERLLLFLKTNNLQSVTVDRLLEIKAYA